MNNLPKAHKLLLIPPPPIFLIITSASTPYKINHNMNSIAFLELTSKPHRNNPHFLNFMQTLVSSGFTSLWFAQRRYGVQIPSPGKERRKKKPPAWTLGKLRSSSEESYLHTEYVHTYIRWSTEYQPNDPPSKNSVPPSLRCASH